MIGHPIFDELPTPHVLFCPILLDPPSPLKIGHHLCTFPNTNVVYKRAGKLIRNQLRFQMEFQAGWVVS